MFPASLQTTVTLQIGGWTDTLYDHQDWSRLPEIVRRTQVPAGAGSAAATVTIGSAIGGLLYVILPAGLQLGPLELAVSAGLANTAHSACASSFFLKPCRTTATCQPGATLCLHCCTGWRRCLAGAHAAGGHDCV